jgi:hypothetical protein
MFKKACLRGKEHVNFFCSPQCCQPELKESPDLSRKIPEPFLMENPLKFPYDTNNSLKKHHNFSKNVDLLYENNFKNRQECLVWAPNISYFSLKPLF